MKKTELKNIIKECVREVIFEEGLISGLVSEVVQGLGAGKISTSPGPSRSLQTDGATRHMSETKKQVLDAMGTTSYEDAKKKFSNPELFEGTKPIVENNGRSPLSGVEPNDPGVDISNIPGFGSWSNVAAATRK
jgi:hypothetical protein